MPPDTTVKLVVIRKGAEKTISLTLGELPATREARAERRDQDRDYDYRRRPNRDDRSDRSERRRDRDERRGDRDERRRYGDRDLERSEGPRLGLSLAPAGDEPGVVVADVDPSGPAADFGFKPGDVILDVAGKTVTTPADVRKAMGDARAEGKRSVLLAGQDGTGDAVRRHSARPGVSSNMLKFDAASMVEQAGSVFGAAAQFGASRRHSSPPPAERTRGTGYSPVPTHYRSSSPGIRRPRWDRGRSRGGGAIHRPSKLSAAVTDRRTRFR